MCTYYIFLRQLYAAASSLTTRRGHLGKAHLPEYLELIQARGLPNKLPHALKQQREEQRARDAARTAFSVKTFEDQLVTVIVSNDLVCSTPLRSPVLSCVQSINLIENRDFRDLLLLLRESLQDNDIPHRSTLRTRIMDAWLKYYNKLKAELQVSTHQNLKLSSFIYITAVLGKNLVYC